MKATFGILLVNVALVCASHVMMTTLVHNSPVGQVRFENYKLQAEKFGFPFDYINVTKVSSATHRYRSLNIAYLALLDRFQFSGYEKGILCEDDTEFIPNFAEELALTEAAAGDFSILGLCSLFIWSKHDPYTGIHQ